MMKVSTSNLLKLHKIQKLIKFLRLFLIFINEFIFKQTCVNYIFYFGFNLLFNYYQNFQYG